MYKLKKGQESFTPVEGPMAGREFAPGRIYEEIPPGTEGRFEKIQPQPTPAQEPEAARPARSVGKKGVLDAPEGEVKS